MYYNKTYTGFWRLSNKKRKKKKKQFQDSAVYLMYSNIKLKN